MVKVTITSLVKKIYVVTPLGRSVRMTLTFLKWGLGNPPGLPKTQNSIAGVKTPCLEVFFLSRKVLKRRCRKWPCMSHSDFCSTSYVRKKGRESNLQFDSRPLKVGIQPNSLSCRRRATYRWKSLDEGYNFDLDLIVIEGLHKKLCALKVAGVVVVAISRLPLGSPGTKGHLDVALVKRRKV
jgi:hypothetical protein